MSSTTASYLHNYHPLQHTETPPVYYHNQSQASNNDNVANITEVISINSGTTNTILTPLSNKQ